MDGRGAAPSQRGEEEGGMDHLTDPLTVAAAAAPSLSAGEREIEVGDWGEGGIAEKLFWPLHRLQRLLWSNGPTAALHYSWFVAVVGFTLCLEDRIFSLPRDSYSRGNARSMKGSPSLPRPRLAFLVRTKTRVSRSTGFAREIVEGAAQSHRCI